jgi:Rhs element Vgr protein
MAGSPLVDASDLITFTVKVQGKTICDCQDILSIQVNRQVNKIPYCEITMLDGSPDEQGFPASDKSLFIPGNTIEVMAGYENNNETIFQGIIVKHALRMKEDESPVLEVVCKDTSLKMTKIRKNAYYTNTTDNTIISTLIGNYGLTADVAFTSPQLKEVIQYDATDWDFMLARADINGLIVIVNDGTVSVKSPDSITQEVLTLTYGVDILEFEGEIDAETQFKSVKSSAWDVGNQSLLSSTATPSNFNTGNLSTATLADALKLDPFNIQSGAFLESDMLSAWAKAKATKSTYSKVRGTIRFQGNASVLPGVLLDLKRIGDRFTGKGFVSGVKHEIQEGNWITTAEIGLSPEWFTAETRTEAPLAAGLLPGIQGLQVGVVKQVDQDPEQQLRVKIDLPLVGTNGAGVWARLGNMYASSGFGSCFFPEVNDEVVVGFFNDDPRFPVILGSLYSKGRSPAFTPDNPNNTKALVTRTQMKIEFQEDKKIITITTPGKNQVVLNDEEGSIKLSDQNSNSITMSSSGIEIKSASAMTIKAATSLALEAATGGSVKVTGGDLSMQAVNISNEGQASFKAKGNATAEFTSSGQVKIQGTMVMIN